MGPPQLRGPDPPACEQDDVVGDGVAERDDQRLEHRRTAVLDTVCSCWKIANGAPSIPERWVKQCLTITYLSLIYPEDSMMKRLIPLVCAVVFVLVATVPAPNPVTVTGTLVDTKCYGMNKDNVMNTHAAEMEGGEMGEVPNCATACATMGIPVGVLEGGAEEGQVYVLIAPATAFAEYMAKEARITGEMAYEGGIIPEKVEVKNEDGTWEAVSIEGMM